MSSTADMEQPQTGDDRPDAGVRPDAGQTAAAQFSVESLLESLSEGVVVADSAGRIVLVNRRTEEIFGYRRSELLGQPLAMLLPSRYVASHSRMLSSFFANPKLRHMGSGFDLVGRRRDGEEIPLEIGLNPLPGESGPMSLATIVDISRRKQIEEDLKRRSEEMDSFTHTLAHDLRGSLSLVKGFGELLLEDLDEMDPEEIRRYVTIMMSNSGKMAAIISGMMMLASTNQKEVPVENLEMMGIVQDALARLDSEVSQMDGQLILPDSLPSASGHAPWIEEVWVSYIGNAIRHSGQPALIEIGCQPMEGGQLAFWVKDNGPGIPPADLPALFQPAEKTALPDSASSGLGLDIVLRMVKKLNGQAWVESAEGAGATFFFSLPAAVETPGEAA